MIPFSALTEKIVTVLPKMKCPYLIEPHQIQGLDFINIFPVIQWLVKKSVENRAEKAEKLKAFAIGQFHNHFSLKSDRDAKQRYTNAVNGVKDVLEFYSPRRIYKRKDAGPEDEKTRVRITLLEYGNKGKAVPSTSTTKVTSNVAEGPEGGTDAVTATNEVRSTLLGKSEENIEFAWFCLFRESKIAFSSAFAFASPYLLCFSVVFLFSFLFLFVGVCLCYSLSGAD